METDGEECSVQWLYAPDGMPIGRREMQQSGQADYVFLFDNYFDFVPGEDGVVKVEGIRSIMKTIMRFMTYKTISSGKLPFLAMVSPGTISK